MFASLYDFIIVEDAPCQANSNLSQLLLSVDTRFEFSLRARVDNYVLCLSERISSSFFLASNFVSDVVAVA